MYGVPQRVLHAWGRAGGTGKTHQVGQVNRCDRISALNNAGVRDFVEQGVEVESQGAPTKWIEPVRREDEAIPDYGVFKAAGTMRSVNDIKFFSWKRNRQWVLGTVYQKNRPPHRSNQPEEMPSA